ncbi:MAG: HDOD domain-containing protein [Desulfobacteraceae bacterium]|nr:HDOD domain-containing protein [Desulfobacteraceae bacterium]
MNQTKTQNTKRLAIIKSYLSKMPSLSTTVSKVLHVCNSPDTSANDLNKVVSLDPVLTGNVLNLINSAYYAMREPVTSLTKAIIMLGLNTIKNLALSTAILGNLQGEDESESELMDNFWIHSISTGVTSKAIAAASGVLKADHEEYFVAGLLHDIGKIPLIRCFSKDYATVMNYAFEREVALSAAEKKVFGIDHMHAGKLIADKWSLRGIVFDTICYHHTFGQADEDHQKIVRTIALADIFAKTLDSKDAVNCVPDNPILKTLLEKNEIKYSSLITLKQDILDEIEDAKVFLNITKKDVS